MEITGSNFKCPEEGCDLKCKFGEEPFAMFTKGTVISETKIHCPIPKYAQPEILRVEVTLNGEDYTNDKHTYGYYDPFILNVHPRLINPNGTTEITLYGYGFVNSTSTKNLKVRYDNPENKIKCSNKDCVHFGHFISKNEIKVQTFPQTEMVYNKTGESVYFDGFYPEVNVYDQYTDNNITIWYYTEPEFMEPVPNQIPAN